MKFDFFFFQLYSCSGGLPEKWCTDEDDKTRIVVTGANRAHRSSFKIKITGVKTYDCKYVAFGIL